jgi:N-acylneuraminate cytidylyltransferase
MVVSVNELASSPYYNCFEVGEDGFLKKTLDSSMITRRQDAPKTYEYNGAIYIFNLKRLKETHYGNFTKRVMYEMDKLHSVDLDTMMDWKFAEFLVRDGEIKF